MRWFSYLIAASAVACAGCGDEPAIPNAPSCEPGEMAVRGTVAGMDVSLRRAVVSYSFVNALGESEGTVEVLLSEEDLLALAWPRLVANGAAVEARGELDLIGTDGWRFGNCQTEGYPSLMQMDEDGQGGRFLLEGLQTAPFCRGASVGGSLTGCFRAPPSP